MWCWAESPSGSGQLKIWSFKAEKLGGDAKQTPCWCEKYWKYVGKTYGKMLGNDWAQPGGPGWVAPLKINMKASNFGLNTSDPNIGFAISTLLTFRNAQVLKPCVLWKKKRGWLNTKNNKYIYIYIWPNKILRMESPKLPFENGETCRDHPSYSEAQVGTSFKEPRGHV